MAVLVGWQLLVANVGDSCAYLDTGAEVVQVGSLPCVNHVPAGYNSNLLCMLYVAQYRLAGIVLIHLALVINHQDLSSNTLLQVSGNHRLDDSKAERKRCERGGAEIARSELEGKPVGPLRVWPGGLAMSRTLGDYEVRLKSTPMSWRVLGLHLCMLSTLSCPIWQRRTFFGHGRACWGGSQAVSNRTLASQMLRHTWQIYPRWALQTAHCALLKAMQDASHQHAHRRLPDIALWPVCDHAAGGMRQRHPLLAISNYCLSAGRQRGVERA